MPYIHLANGNHLRVTAKELTAMQEESGTPHAIRQNGYEYHVVGIYPDEVEHAPSEAEKAVQEEKNAVEKAAFDEWRKTQTDFEGGAL